MNKELLASIAETISDYRSGEIPIPTPEHVERWVQQFPAEAQDPILEEVDHILKRTYFSEKRIRQFLDGLAQNEKLVGDSPREFWERVDPLRIQVRGTSQGDMTTKLSQVVHERYGVHLGSGATPPKTYIYLDDVLFTGNTALGDLGPWISSLPNEETFLHMVFVAVHGYAEYRVDKNLKELIRDSGKPITFRIWRSLVIEDRKYCTDKSEVLRPTRTNGDPGVESFAAGLAAAGFPPVLRPQGAMPDRPFFCSAESRDILEWELLRAGSKILHRCANPKPAMRPLGFSTLRILGFGATVVTYRNCPNNAPLALWWGNPNEPEGTPLAWYPLLPRRSNPQPHPAGLNSHTAFVGHSLPSVSLSGHSELGKHDEAEEEHDLLWESAAKDALERTLDSLEFDAENGVIWGYDSTPLSNMGQLRTYLSDAYTDAWYAYVPFDDGEAVFEDDGYDAANEAIEKIADGIRRLGWDR